MCSDGSLRVWAGAIVSRIPSSRNWHRPGIRQISQIADDNYFRGSAVNPSWEDVQVDQARSRLNQNAVVLTLCLSAVNPVWVDPAEATQWRIQNDSLTAQPGEAALINVNRDLRAVVEMRQLSVLRPEPVALAVLNPVAFLTAPPPRFKS